MEIVVRSPKPHRESRSRGFQALVWDYYGKASELLEGPQVFMVDFPEAGSSISPHFHDVDQYQIFVRGNGRLGSNEAGPMTFHYADAYTPYGPIVGADQGIAF